MALVDAKLLKFFIFCLIAKRSANLTGEFDVIFQYLRKRMYST